jgi:hypothetical protein
MAANPVSVILRGSPKRLAPPAVMAKPLHRDDAQTQDTTLESLEKPAMHAAAC